MEGEAFMRELLIKQELIKKVERCAKNVSQKTMVIFMNTAVIAS